MIQALTYTAASLPLSAFVLRSGSNDAPLLLFLYVCVGSALLAWFSLPSITWVPDISSF